MIYNFPGAASGIDLDSDFINELADLPNCCGVKLTCAGIGKGMRIANHVRSRSYRAKHGEQRPFIVLQGFVESLLPAMVARQDGCITGTGNLIPKTIVKLYDTIVTYLQTGELAKLQEAQELQDRVNEADWVIVKGGIGGTKYALDHFVQKGLGGRPRKPLPAADEATKTLIEQGLADASE